MALCNETPCNCNPETDPCGCKTSSDAVVYTGPTLPCTGIENCTPVTEVISTISEYLCSSELIQVLLNTIINNETLLAQFTTIINNNIECQTIWDCATTSTTTTSNILVAGRMMAVFPPPDTPLIHSFHEIEHTWVESDYPYTLNSIKIDGVEQLTTEHNITIFPPGDLVLGPGLYGGTFVQNINDWLNSIPEVAATGIVFYDDMSIIDVPNIYSTYEIVITGTTAGPNIYTFFKNNFEAGARPNDTYTGAYGLPWVVFALP